MNAFARRICNYAEYLTLESRPGEKNEYYQGHILAMAGGTVAHARLKTRLTGIVFRGLEGKPCQPYDEALRIRVVETDLATYPDLSIICGDPQLDAQDRNAAVNPTVLFAASCSPVATQSSAVFSLILLLPVKFRNSRSRRCLGVKRQGDQAAVRPTPAIGQKSPPWGARPLTSVRTFILMRRFYL